MREGMHDEVRAHAKGVRRGPQRIAGLPIPVPEIRQIVVVQSNDGDLPNGVDEAMRSERWSAALARGTVTRHDLAEANHTFSKDDWRNVVAEWTLQWVRSL